MAYRIDVFNQSGDRVAILQDEILVSANVSLSKYAAPTLSISLPADSDKKEFISPLYNVKIWNTKSGAYEYSLFKLYQPDIIDDSGKLLITAVYHGYLTNLSKEFVVAYDTGAGGDTFTNVITAVLAFQVSTTPITVGTITPADTVAIAIESSDIHSILNKIQEAYGGWFEVNPDLTLDWNADSAVDPLRELRRSKNLKAISYVPQYSEIVNRVYAYGAGETEARVDLTDAGEAQEYIEDAASQAIYGIQTRMYVDKTITHPATLLKYAQKILAEKKDPPYQYSVDILNLAEIDKYDYTFENLALDIRVRVIDDLLDVDIDTSIISLDLDLKNPVDIQIELSTVKNDLSDLFGQILSLQDMQNSIATQIGAGQVTVLGAFTVIDWASAGQTTINGGQITANTVTVTQLNFVPTDGTNIVGTINASSEGITIDADKITLDGEVSVTDDLHSHNYSAGSAGWIIHGDGSAEFSNITIRGDSTFEGTINTSSIAAGETLTLAGDIKTADDKFLVQTTGIKLKSGAADTTYIDFVQDTAQIYLYDVGTQRVLITPTGAITLTTDAGTPISINSTSASDCISVTTAVATRRAIVCSATSGAAAAYATAHFTQNSAGGYAIYAGGKIQTTGEALLNSLVVTLGSSLHAVTISGNLTMVGTANITGVADITCEDLTASDTLVLPVGTNMY